MDKKNNKENDNTEEYPKDCTDCNIKGMTWGCLNGDMPCPWGVMEGKL